MADSYVLFRADGALPRFRNTAEMHVLFRADGALLSRPE